MTVGEVVREVRRALAASALGIEPREAVLLVRTALGVDETTVLAHPERLVDEALIARLRELVTRRLGGEPYAYLVGEREFYGRPFAVDRRVLVPRPETEHVLETALRLPLPPRPRVVDVGTGSGCLAVTLALELGGAKVIGTDVSLPALDVARANVARHGCAGRVRLVAADLAAPLALADVHLVVSNPPYLAESEASSLSPEVRDFEPHGALFGGTDGLVVVRRLLAAASALRAGAWVVLELGIGQAARVANELAPTFALAEVVADHAGIDRIVVLKRSRAEPR